MYDLVIGLEVHARIKTKTKLFCNCKSEVFDEKPNDHICPVCAGYPGQLPVLNSEALNKIVLAGKALNCEINKFSKFDRKSYFYPDLPMGYQISQYDQPVVGKGGVDVEVHGTMKRFGIHRIHLENDAGKLTHSMDGSEVDLNRAGCPLMEIVTEPDFRNPEEVKVFLQELQKILRAIGASDADMEKGQLRADVNVSIMPKGSKEFGTRAEIKNMNSFSAIEKAISYEYKRQSKLLDSGEEVIQETRGWDDKKGISLSQRGKEEAADYRYFPEPDLPPVYLDENFIKSIEVPELPNEKYKRFQDEYGVKKEDAFIIGSDKDLSNYYEQTVKLSGDAKKSVSWILSELMQYTKEDLIGVQDSKVTPDHIAQIIKMIQNGDISGKIGKEIFPEVYKTGKDPKQIVEEKGLKQMSDTGQLKGICKKILDSNPQIIEQIKGGKDKAFGALVGQVMKETKGQANPGMVNQILKEML